MKSYKIEIKWAFIFFIMMLAWMVGEKLAGLHDQHIDKHPIYSNFVAIPAILIYLLALLDKRKNHYGGNMTYKQGFVTGIILTGIITLLAPLTQYITSTFITRQYFTNAINYVVSTGKMQPAEAERYFNLKSYILQGLIATPVMGLLTTAVVALFAMTRRKKNSAV
jgi:hypothetical protein